MGGGWADLPEKHEPWPNAIAVVSDPIELLDEA
jgi:hypothetical protein